MKRTFVRYGYWFALLLPLILFFPHFHSFIYLRAAEYSDLMIAHYPNLIYLKHAIQKYQSIPLWSPAMLGGFPYFANPLAGLWYPPGWLSVLWQAPWVFNLLVFLHLLFGGIGTALLLRRYNISIEMQIFGGLAFMLMPKMLAHFAAGHLTLLYALSWTPWLILVAQKPGRGLRQPGFILAVVFLADPRWAAYCGLIWLAWIAFKVVYGKEKQGFKQDIRIGENTSQLLLAILLAAPLLIPLLEYTFLSSRSVLTVNEVLVFSLPPAMLLTLFMPLFNGQVEWVLYPGAIILIGSLLALLLPEVRLKGRFFLWLAAASLVFSLGESVPLMDLFARLPGFNLLRVPSRSLFIFGFSLIILAAFSFDELLSGIQNRKLQVRVNLLLTGLFLNWVSIGVIGFLRPDLFAGAMQLGALFGITAAGLTIILHRLNRPRYIKFMLLILLGTLDWTAFALMTWEPRSPQEVFSEGDRIASWLSQQPGRFRVYSPSYAIPRHTAANYDLEMLDGIDPLQLQSLVVFMDEATGVPRDGYSITMPPLQGEIATVNQNAIPNLDMLGALNVRYIVASFDMNFAGLELATIIGDARIYLNTRARGEAWVVNDRNPDQNIMNGRVTWSPNQIEIETAGLEDSKLVLAEIDYPGWQVAGASERPPYQTILRHFDIESESENVIVRFRPTSLYVGLVLFAIGLFLLLKLSPGFYERN